MSGADVVIVGAGAIGAAIAFELSSRGADVTVLERDEPGAGCSYGNAGLICPSHAEALASPQSLRQGMAWMWRRDSPFHLRPRPRLVPWLARFAAAALPSASARSTAALRAVATTSLERHAALAAAGLPTSFERRGLVSVYGSERSFGGARRRAANGSQVLDTATALALQPALAPGIAGAIFHPAEGHCDPAQFVGALLAAARENGARVRHGVETLRLRTAGDRVSGVDATTGTLSAGAVVLAAGAWSRALARQVGVPLPLEGGKGYHVELSTGPFPAPIPVYIEDSRVVATPLDGRVRLAGTLDLAGMDMRVDPARLDALRRAAQGALALPRDVRIVRVWRGLRPCVPDGLPVIGRTERFSNLVLATGHAMLGVTLAPVTGEIVARTLTGEGPQHPTEPFSPARFHRLWDGWR